jgi:purine-binding chemotaxis protein CheW
MNMNALENSAVAEAAALAGESSPIAVPTEVLEPRNGMPAAVVTHHASNDAAPLVGTVLGVAPTPAAALFGSFFLCNEEFALPASVIREVVNYPDKVTPMPLSPPFLEGVFTLRGTVIPVLNLGRIFDPEAAAAHSSHKIAIVDHEEIQVGLVFHSTGEILRVRPEQCATLQYRDSATHNVIGGTIRLDDGARLLQILDPVALIKIENVPQVRALQSAGRKIETSQFHLQAERRQCVSFRVGQTTFAFEMSAIREIIDVPPLTSSVLTSKLCLGRFTLRGSVVAVVDFGAILGVGRRAGSTDGTPMAPGSAQRIVIARIGDASIGLLVDSVDNIFSFFPGDLLPIPLFSGSRAGMFGGCIHKEGIGAIIFLDHDGIFSSSEVIDMTRGHAELYQHENTGAAIVRKTTGAAVQRQVYITFTVGDTCALEIRKVREIIDFPVDMITPPSMPSFVEGILNLRRQMITILNLRSLYGMPALGDNTLSKVLIIERGDERFGLMVDSVENIVTVPDSDRMPTPRLVRSNDPGDMRNEMLDVIELTGADNVRRTLSVFEIDRFLERVATEMAAA